MAFGLSGIKGYTGTTSEEENNPYGLPNDPYESVARMRTRYDLAGQEAPEPEKKTPTLLDGLMGALEVLDAPGNALRGGIQESATGGNFLTGVGRGLANALPDALAEPLGGKQYSTGDWIRAAGVDNQAVEFVGGLAGDILLDPTTYLTGGASGVLKAMGKGAVKGAAKESLQKTSGSVLKNLTKAFDKSDELSRVSALSKDARFGSNNIDDLGSLAGVNQANPNLDQAYSSIMGDNKIRTKALEDRAGETAIRAIDEQINFMKKVEKVLPNIGENSLRFISDLANGDIYRAFNSTDHKVFTRAEQKINELFGVDYLKNASPEADTAMRNIFSLYSDTMDSITSADTALLGRIKNIAEDPNFYSKIHKSTRDSITRTAEIYGKSVAEINYLNGLKASVDEFGDRTFVSFMGNPLVDITDNLSSMKQGAVNLLRKSPIAEKVAKEVGDFMTGAFSNALSVSGKLNTNMRDSLDKVTERLSKLQANNSILPRNVLDGALRSLGENASTIGEQGIMHNGKLVKPNDMFIYWKEGKKQILNAGISKPNAFQDMINKGTFNVDDVINEMKKTVKEKTNADLDLKLGFDEYAAKKYLEDVLPYTMKNPQIEDYFKEINSRVDLMNSYIASFDKVLGKTYDLGDNYIHHAYENYMASDLEELVQAGGISRGKSTASNLAPTKQREYSSIAAAEALDPALKPITNVVDAMAIRMAYSARMGHRVQFLEGTKDIINKLDNIMANTDSVDNAYRASQELNQSIPNAAFGPQPELARQGVIDQAESLAAGRSTIETLVRGLGDDGVKELKDVVRMTPPSNLERSMFTKVNIGNEAYYVHNDVASQFQKLDKIFFNDMEFNKVKKVYDEATRMIKTAQTILRPVFHVKNNTSEFMMTALDLGGDNLQKSYQKAFDIYKQVGKRVTISGREYPVDEALNVLGVLMDNNAKQWLTYNGKQYKAKSLFNLINGENMVELGGKKYTIKEIRDQFAENGLGESGMTRETFKESIPDLRNEVRGVSNVKTQWKQDMADPNRARGLAKGLAKGYYNVAQTASNASENLHRMAHFLGALDRGEAFKNAAMSVKKFHVDYSNLSRFEKNVMRRVVPYYTWMRNNLPMQLKLTLEKPGYPAAIGHIVDNAYGALGNPEVADMNQDNLTIPLWEDENGNVKMLNIGLPLADLSKIKFNPKEQLKSAIGDMSPLLKAPVEMAAGKNIAMDVPADDPAKYAASMFGIGNDIYKALSQMGREPGQFDRPNYNLSSAVLPVSTVNPKQVNLSKVYEYRDKLQADMADKKAEGNEILPVVPEGSKKKGYHTSYDKNPNYKKYKEKYNPENRLTP